MQAAKYSHGSARSNGDLSSDSHQICRCSKARTPVRRRNHQWHSCDHQWTGRNVARPRFTVRGEPPRRSSTYSCGGCGPDSFAPNRVPTCTSLDRTLVPHPRCVGSAWRLETRGRRFGCACCVVTSAVATSQRTSTPESISAKPAIPWPGPTKSGVWTGCGAMWTRRFSTRYDRDLRCQGLPRIAAQLVYSRGGRLDASHEHVVHRPISGARPHSAGPAGHRRSRGAGRATRSGCDWPCPGCCRTR
jgi:hypothetical protein